MKPIRYKDDNGDLHNDNGPAVVYPGGSKEYWVHGQCHNDNGPAVIFVNGTMSYYIRDIYCSTAKDYQQLAKISDKQLAMIILKHGNIS